MEMQTVRADEDTQIDDGHGNLTTPRLTWEEYIDLREKIEAERQEEEAKTKPVVTPQDPVSRAISRAGRKPTGTPFACEPQHALNSLICFAFVGFLAPCFTFFFSFD